MDEKLDTPSTLTEFGYHFYAL